MHPCDFNGQIWHRNVHTIREAGIHASAKEILLALNQKRRRFWLHLDWDVLDETELPSADFLMPFGLTWQELTSLVRPFLQDSLLSGVSLACYNPDNDPDLSDGKKIIRALSQLFA